MKAGVYDMSGREFNYLPFEVVAGDESPVLQLQVLRDGQPNPILASDLVDPDLSILARKSGTGDPFVNIGSNSIDLSSEPADTLIPYDFKVAAGVDLAGRVRAMPWIGVATNGGAGWRL